jgi:Ca2+-dependent lipid-binding protein
MFSVSHGKFLLLFSKRSVYVVLCCRDLPRMDLIGTSDPYVILELLPVSLYHKQPKEFKTVIQKRTLNPEYNETFQW